jgi:hypothetical protein
MPECATMSKDMVGKARWSLLLLLLVGSVTCRVASAEDAGALDGKALKVSGIEVDIKKREVRLDATVCLSRGILEYLVCLPGTFEHETIFTVKCKPSQFHLALLAVGLVPRPFIPDEKWWEKAQEDKQARVSVAVEYDQDGKKQRRRITEFLVNRERQDGTVPDRWIFTGSAFYNEDGKTRYAADATGIVIGLIPRGAAVIQLGQKVGIPYRGDDQGLEINTDTIPAVGTAVHLVFTPLAEKGEQAGRPTKGIEPGPPKKPD